MGLLRLFLAVSVLVTHLRFGRGICGLSFLDGGLAVQCFFIISGFYMALVLNEKYNYKGSYGTFIVQRFLRLFPVYIVVTILILVLEGLVSYLNAAPYGIYEVWAREVHAITPLSVCFYVLTNLIILGQDWLWFLYQDSVTGQLYLTPYGAANATHCNYFLVNMPTWTLSVEMTFYLVAPFLVRKSLRTQSAFLLASLAFRSACYWMLDPKSATPWTYYFSPSALFFFMAGSLGYHFYKQHRAGMEAFAIKYQWAFWAFGVLMLIERRLPMKEYFFALFVPVAIVMVPLLFALTRNNKRDRFIGELSYPYYVIHFHIVMAAEAVLHENYNSVFGPVCAIVTLVLAYFMYQTVELRTEHFRENLFRRIHPQTG